MPNLQIEIPSPLPPPQPRRKLWTRAECARLESCGALDYERLELVEGELIEKMGKKRPHINAMLPVFVWLQKAFGTDYVSPETPIDVAAADNPINEPEPDIVAVNRPNSTFSSNPKPGDLRLVVEIAHTSLSFDVTTKGALYARAAIVEYWVLDVEGRRLIVHRNPTDGRYLSVVAYDEGEAVAPLAAPHAEFAVSAAFPG